MEIEITRAVELTPQQVQMLDLHSFLNIFNVLEGELQLLGLGTDDAHGVAPALLVADTIKNSLTEGTLDRDWTKRLDQLERITGACVKRLREKHGDILSTPEAEESAANIQSVLRVLHVRADEYIARQAGSQAWIPHSIARLQDNFQNFLAAVERNSKGRYRIIFNIAAQEERDYVVNLKIESVHGDSIVMPPVMQDIFRDLIANARKYTRPGGVITAGLYEDDRQLHLVVEDNGVGIPSGELDRVVDFGYRGTNVRHLPTRGAGFGLTKAYLLTKALGGRMWIRSVVEAGTRITITLPKPA